MGQLIKRYASVRPYLFYLLLYLAPYYPFEHYRKGKVSLFCYLFLHKNYTKTIHKERADRTT